MSGDIEQEQIRSAREYDDTLASGAGLEAPTNLLLPDDLNAVISQLNKLIGLINWYDLPGWSIQGIREKKFVYIDPFAPATQQFTVSGGPDSGVLLAAADVNNTPKVLAVGAGSTTTGGVMVAPEALFTTAGTLGVGLSQVIDGGGILLNKVDIVDDTTNEPIKDNGDDIFGLLQTVNGTSDGTAIAANPSENLQISFVKVDAGTNAITATTLPVGSYNFNLRRCSDFFNLPPGALISGSAALPDSVSPGTQETQQPWREIRITAGPITPGDVLNIQTGVFTTAGAQTVTATFGTTLLPSSAALFNADERVEIYRNGVLQSKPLRVTWVSPTQIAFVRRLRPNERIQIRTSASY